jgi:phytoene synthase
MINKTFYSIFQQGSRTYFYSSLFFPTSVKNDVFVLYGFVRKADNYVDSIPQEREKFYRFKENYYRALDGDMTGDIIIDSFVTLAQKKGFQKQWVDAFFHAMEMDLEKKRYASIDETLEYIYGSAEVIGLMMGKIMGLPEEALRHAKYLGRAMQYINFIRDIAEDLRFGRIYFPQLDLEQHGLTHLDYEYTKRYPERFTAFISTQIKRYCQWQMEAEQGYRFIPKRYLISVKTAADMYNWTAKQIFNHPFIIYEWKVKPLITQIITTTLTNMINPENRNNHVDFCMYRATKATPVQS